MAALFRDFSFESASSLPSAVFDAERAAMNVSPTSLPSFKHVPTRLPTPPPTVGDLTQAFDQHTLHIYPDEPLTSPSDEIAFPAHLHDPCPRGPAYSRLDSATLRMQRQANVRMQCSASHTKDISVLVQSMIEDGDQCNICDPKSRSSSSASSTVDEDEDEGVDMEYEPSSEPHFSYALNFRRSGERVAGCATVSRTVRIRKKSRVMKRSSH